ncbi:DUF4132 domain-containing protein [Glycomyces luteolus]|uniref:DUF4132 domain-containing protein n=1 Tax=Glycomyces luteolus TaxID=2670330 RepID=A0A9X3P7X4_9ACTN|nr:DUF4132 domain-containing protein [Glycomyces luteolus]MDA1359932.1 DUF4132 domain-containing protein [Glycomyces luteolus]
MASDVIAVALPDEDRPAFPETWQRFVQPRRGAAKPRKIKRDPEAGRALLGEHADRLRSFRLVKPDDEFAVACSAFLDGAADVLGAAVALRLTKLDYGSTKFRPVFDALAADHGLPFAAAALAEAFALDQEKNGQKFGLNRRPLAKSGWAHLYDNTEVRQIRALIAAAADYEAVVAALAERRTSPELRLAVSVLVPDEEAWLNEVCEEHRSLAPNASYSVLFLALATTEQQLDTVEIDASAFYWLPASEIADLVHRLGVAALPVIEGRLNGYVDANDRKILYRALAALPSERAMTLLLDRLDAADAMGFAMEAAANFPRRALELIARRVPGADDDQRKQLSALLHSDPILLDTALPLMDADTRSAVASLTADLQRVPEAPSDAVPPLLAMPPWTTGAAASEPVVVKGLEPAPINRMVWAEGEYEAWSNAQHHGFARYSKGDWDRTRWESEAGEFDARHVSDQAVLLALAPRAIAADLLPHWRPEHHYFSTAILQRIAANLGADAAPQLLSATSYDMEQRRLLLVPVANLAAARYAADALARLKTMRPFALAWLDRHRADAAALLVPDALGKAKKLRAAAEVALRYLASTHGPDTVREAAVQYGDEAAAAIKALVDIDPLMPVGVQIPQAGAWASPMTLPQVLLNGRERALPNAAVRNLVTVLALGTPEYHYPGVAVVAETCDRISLARFSLALFEQWITAGAPSEDGWALTQLAHFADDEAVRLLQPLVAKWPGESQHQRAVKGLKALGAIGTEAALRAINQIAEKAKFAAIKAEAREQIETIAANLGLTADQLGDRLVPDFGLREESALVLDYGQRRFKVGFDEALKPFVSDMDGKPRKSLPKPAAKDDELLADAAYKRFAALRKDLRTVAADQVKRLERAMVQGRTWTPAEFEEHFVRHPLVWHLARRLVWTAETDGTRTTFRLAEDKGCTDVEENEYTLPANAAVRLAHPAIMGDEVEAWAEILADYEILQPFPQLGRPVMAFTEEELRTGRLTRFEGITVPVGRLLGLTSKGWERSSPMDAGIEAGMSCVMHGAGYLVLGLDPGIWVGAIDQCPDQTLRTVVLSRQSLDGWSVPRPKAGFGPVDPVVASETLAALARATDLS